MTEVAFATNDDVELVEYVSETESDAKQKRRRRRRRRSSKQPALLSAAEILSLAAKEGVESSPSSFMTDEGTSGRKMSALELDKILEEEETQGFTSTTLTPGSMDSSRSLWELGTIDAEEDSVFTRPVVASQRMQNVDQLTAGIESVLNSIPAIPSATADGFRRMCLPAQEPRSNRLCIDNVPKIDISPLTSFLWSVKDHVVASVDSLTAAVMESRFAQPDGVSAVLASLQRAPVRQEGGIPMGSVPILNRKQRRAAERNVYPH